MGSNDFIDEFPFVGHSDVVMGAVALKDDGLCERLRFLQNGKYKWLFKNDIHRKYGYQYMYIKEFPSLKVSELQTILIIQAFGAVPSPFDSFLVNRGLKTLHVRMKEHMKNGLAVAKFLESHPCVEKVIHPGMCL